jgi:phosphoglycerate dehydrogenase-like enzyme
MAKALHARRPELETRGARTVDLGDADLAWGEAYLGFKRPPTTDMGAIRWVHCTGAGVDAWLYPESLDPGILLTRTSESFGPMIAEWVIARVLAFSQQLPDLARAQMERRWAPRDLPRLSGTRAVIVGMGDVGRAVTHKLQAFDVDITAVSRTGRTDSPIVDVIHPVAALPGLVAGAHWIISTLPLTAGTDGLISREVLAGCTGAVLLNTGRGAVVDEAALPEALEKGWLSGAALDVFTVEPLPSSSPLWSHPRVMVSPHISGLTTVDGACDGFLECLDALERGVLPRWAVDRERGY